MKGPLTTNELSKQSKLIIRKVQLQYSHAETFKIDQKKINVKVSEEKLYQCFGKILVKLPIFLLKGSVYTEKLVEETHILTIHWGVTLTMAKVRSECRIPSLRQLLKKTIKKYYGCKRFRVSHCPEPSTRLLPVERITQNLPFKLSLLTRQAHYYVKQKGGKKLRCTYYYLHAVLAELYILNSYQINVHRSFNGFKND